MTDEPLEKKLSDYTTVEIRHTEVIREVMINLADNYRKYSDDSDKMIATDLEALRFLYGFGLDVATIDKCFEFYKEQRDKAIEDDN